MLGSCSTCTGVTLETTDFTSIANTLFIADGNTTATTTITIIDDTIVEADESITIVLTNLVAPATILESNFITPTFIAGSLINASLAGSFEVVNNDTTSFTISSINTLEDSNQTVTITLDNAVADGFTLFLESGFGSAIEDTDYASIDSNQLFFSGAANETETFQLLVIDDLIIENNETLQLSIGTVLATTVDTATIIIDATTVATILNDDSVILNIADTSASEDTTNINFSVSINRAVFGGFTATFETAAMVLLYHLDLLRTLQL